MQLASENDNALPTVLEVVGNPETSWLWDCGTDYINIGYVYSMAAMMKKDPTETIIIKPTKELNAANKPINTKNKHKYVIAKVNL